ncbi:MAG: tyrosine-type recombinase/integrase [Thermoanaerobaculia bacterium]
MAGVERLVGELLYGTGLRVIEAVRLRVKDLDFARSETMVRDGKGSKDRITMLPRSLSERLAAQLARVRELHDQDMAAGMGAVYMPDALSRKYPGSGFPRGGSASIRGAESDAGITLTSGSSSDRSRLR